MPKKQSTGECNKFKKRENAEINEILLFRVNKS